MPSVHIVGVVFKKGGLVVIRFILFCFFIHSAVASAVTWDQCPYNKGQVVKPTQKIELERKGFTVSPEINSSQSLIINSDKWQSGMCEVLWRGNKYLVDPNYLMAWNSTVDLTPVKMGSRSCPISDIKAGKLKWNNSAVSEVLDECEVRDLEIVPRVNVNNRCAPRRFVSQDLSQSQTWEACSLPIECPAHLLPTLEKIESLYFELDSMTCGKARSAARLAEVRNEISKYKGPGYDCMQPFNLPPTKIVVHHSALSPLMGPDVIQRSHMEYRDYADIGYHFVISQTMSGRWRIFEGRPIKYIGAHAGAGLNRDSIGIVIAGNYQATGPTAVNPTADKPLPPPEALVLLEGLIKKLLKEYPIQKLYTHHEIKAAGSGCITECPSAGPTFVTHKISEKFLGKLIATQSEDGQ